MRNTSEAFRIQLMSVKYWSTKGRRKTIWVNFSASPIVDINKPAIKDEICLHSTRNLELSVSRAFTEYYKWNARYNRINSAETTQLT